MTRDNLNYVITFLLCLGATIINTDLHAQAFLGSPISGVNGQDYHIVNYVDWSLDSVHDHNCGSKSYNGHQGTDFVLRSFAHMDSGVNVLAAADGVVTFVKDGEFDREKESVIAKGLGNYICIAHANKYYTYYAHLKKNRLLVKPGDTVKMGDRIAEVASSGNSTDPHLHFELWYDSLYVVDPFKGTCGNADSKWLSEPTYHTHFQTIDFGMHNRLLSINQLREREVTLTSPYRYELTDTMINFWSHHTGLHVGDTLTIAWYTPSNTLHYTYDFVMQQDWWYYYFWTYIGQPNIPGNWEVRLSHNSTVVVKQEFQINDKVNIEESLDPLNNCTQNKNYLTRKLEDWERVDIYSFQGQWIDSRTSNSGSIKLPDGLYVLKVTSGKKSCLNKIQVNQNN